MHSFHIERTRTHTIWDNAIESVLRIEPGATVTLEVANGSGGQFDRNSTSEDVEDLDFSKVNPVTGPIFVESVRPGDALVVDIVDIELESWGWTANIPGFGLLADQFTQPHLRISDVGNASAELLPGLHVPLAPMIGTIGLAPKEPGEHPILPPHRHGGNMDIRHLTIGARLWLPVGVEGALLSVGDTHAAQGDAEVCGTGIETSSQVTLRVNVERDRGLPFPMLETDPVSLREGRAVATTGIGPDLYEAARQATMYMIDEVARRTSMDELDAYLLVSVAGDMKISEIVDAPNWVVSMHLEQALLERL